MQIQAVVLTLLFAAVGVKAAVNEPCYGAGGRAGVCVTTSACSASGGTTISGACPRDAANVKCCTKPVCKSSGNCRWSSDCKGSSLSGDCPGPSSFKCCQSSANGNGGYSAPGFPSVGACKALAVNGAKKVVGAFPGRIRQIYCTRACACGSGSDHCCGKAVDLMNSDAGGTPTTSGKDIAEWALKNAVNVKYVIWGQRIGYPRHAGKAWTTWDTMEDRKDVTQNHWDHVHVSFN